MNKTNISAESIDKFKHSLFEVDQDKIELNLNPNKAYQLCSQNSRQLCQKKMRKTKTCRVLEKVFKMYATVA